MRAPWFTDLFPDGLDWRQWRTLGWLWDEADVLGALARLGGVPLRLIKRHPDTIVGNHLGHLVQQEIPPRRLRLVQNQATFLGMSRCASRSQP